MNREPNWETRARELLAEQGVDRHRIAGTFDDVACYLAPNQVLPAMLALVDEAVAAALASQVNEPRP